MLEIQIEAAAILIEYRAFLLRVIEVAQHGEDGSIGAMMAPMRDKIGARRSLLILEDLLEWSCENGDVETEARRFAEAIANFRTVLSLTPGRRSAQYGLVKALLSTGKPEEALAVIKDIKDEDWRTHFLAIADHALGKNSEADAALAKVIEKFGTESPVSIAEILASRGEVDQAWVWLEKAAATQPRDLALISVDPELFNLKNDPRWLRFLRKIGRAPNQLPAIKLEVKLPDPTAAMTL
jgi:tetratricopeptide (TPR) repeat protein